jgi:hypothetical protein
MWTAMRFSNKRFRRSVIAALLVSALAGRASLEAVAATAGSLDAPPPAGLRWRSLAVGGVDDVVTAIAVDPAGRLAVGDARGVVFGFPGSPMRRVALRGGVLDLAFFEEDTERAPALLAATGLGLYRISSDGRAESVAPGPGAHANAVARIAVAGGVVAVATAAGAFISSEGTRWQRLSEELPSGPATAIALAAREGFVECWVAVRGKLWRSEVRADAERVGSSVPVRIAIPFASGKRPPIDVALDVGSVEVAVVFESDLVVREKSDEGWEQLRPTMPPGASALRIAAALDRYWLATDRGLLVAPSLRGPWRRAPDSSGSDAIFDLETGQGAVYAATDNGLSVAEFASGFLVAMEAGQPASDFSKAPEGEQPPPDSSAADRVGRIALGSLVAEEVPQPVVDPAEPDIHSVHRAALRYLSLDPARMVELRRGVERRGWLPILSFRATRENDRRRHSDYDEAFISGEMRRFNDRDSDSDQELELQLIVSWDLGDIAYHPESIDVSREAREIIELRDDVLDEITQLYFERRRVIAAFALQPDSPAASEFQLRAAQLAADIDAWTGGWFGRQLLDFTP